MSCCDVAGQGFGGNGGASGRGVTILDHGGFFSPSLFHTLDFTGDGVVLTDLGGGVAEINIPGVAYLDDGAPVAGAPHTELNFTGAGVAVSDAGAGRATVSIPGGVIPPSLGFEYFDDFLGPEISTTGALGGGTNSFGMALGANRPGTITTSVVAVGDSSRTSLGGNSAVAFYFGGGETTLEFVHSLVTLSDGVNNIVIRDGFGDAAAADYADGAYLEYDFATHGDHNYRLCTANNSVRTKVDTGIAAVAGSIRKVIITVNAAGTLVSATINGAPAASTINTNIPTTSSRTTQPSFQTVKQLGAASRSVIRDYYWFRTFFTTPR